MAGNDKSIEELKERVRVLEREVRLLKNKVIELSSALTAHVIYEDRMERQWPQRKPYWGEWTWPYDHITAMKGDKDAE